MVRYSNFSQGRSFITFNEFNSVSYYLQSFTLPGFSIGIANQTTPYQSVPLPGDKITYNSLNCVFLLDEDLNVYKSIHDWIDYNQSNNQTSNFSLHFYNNNKKKIVKRFDFFGGWISQENDILINFAADNSTPLELSVLFNYAYYTIADL